MSGSEQPAADPDTIRALFNLEPVRLAAAIVADACHRAAYDAGWWHDLHTGEDQTYDYCVDCLQGGMRPGRNIGEALMLMVSELAEAMEGARKGLMDDKLPHRPMLEVELADAVIRIMDMAGGAGLDLPGAIVEKLAYNAQRADHKPEARAAAGGKAF